MHFKKVGSLEGQEKVVLVEAIVDLQGHEYFKLVILLEVTKLPRNVYYYHLKNLNSKISMDKEINEAITKIVLIHK